MTASENMNSERKANIEPLRFRVYRIPTFEPPDRSIVSNVPKTRRSHGGSSLEEVITNIKFLMAIVGAIFVGALSLSFFAWPGEGSLFVSSIFFGGGASVGYSAFRAILWRY